MRTMTVVTLLALVVTVVVAQPVTITGRVLGPDGEAIEGATVRVATDYRAPVQAVLGETAVRNDGSFTLTFADDAGGARYVLAASADGYVTSGESVEPGAAVELRLSDRTVPVRGRVADEAGRPIEGARVTSGNMITPPLEGFSSLTWHNLLKPTATTDASGEFELRGLFDASKLGLWVDAAGFGGWRGGTKPETFPVTHEWLITLQPEGVIVGRALGDGQPIGGLRISAHSQQGHPEGRGEAVTGAEGRCEMSGLWPSTYEVLVGTGQDWIAPVIGGVAVGAGGRAEGVAIDLVRTAEVRIQLTDAETGEPVTRADVCAASPLTPARGYGGYQASPDRFGRLTFHLPPGRTELEWLALSGRGNARLDPGAVEVPEEMAGRTMEVVLNVRPALLVGGTVVDEDGQPVAGATITLGRDPQALGISEADGSFRVYDTTDGLPFYGNVRGLVRSAEGALVGVLDGDVGAAELRVTLTPAAEMLVHIEDEDGNAVKGVEITVGRAELRGERGTTVYPLPTPFISDADGVVLMGPLPSVVNLMPRASEGLRGMMPRDSRPSVLQMVTLQPGETRDLGTITVLTQKRAVTGIVLRDGAPAAGIAVTASTDSVREGLETTTGADGRFTIEGIPPVGDVGIVAVTADRKLAVGTTWYGEPAGPLTMELLPSSSVQGRTIAADGRPQPGTMICVSAAGVGSLMADVAPLTLSASTPAGEDGRWRVDGLIAGFEYRIYTLEPMYDGGPMRMVQEFGTIRPLGDTEPFEVDIDFRPARDEL